MRRSVPKLIVFLITVITSVVIVGTGMYLIEGRINPGFDNIPKSVYWAVVTMTTVGYGTIVPKTPLGQTVSALMMVLGYSLIVVPTGLVTVDMIRNGPVVSVACPDCARQGHDHDADFCKYCGSRL